MYTLLNECSDFANPQTGKVFQQLEMYNKTCSYSIVYIYTFVCHSKNTRGGGSDVSETPKSGQTRSVAVWPHCLHRRQRTVRTSIPKGLSRTFESPFAYASRGAMYLRCHSNFTSDAAAAPPPADAELDAPAPAADKVPASFSSASSFLASVQVIK